ncbi:MAG: class I SAM-dependent methyltransferase [Candidatus Melainabacteria bacterium]|nr:class I SAM-dependent methyltransferase [Candidatus Melainabacteria bacterium]
MLTLIPKEIEKYASAHTIKESNVLSELVKETNDKTTLPEMQVGHLEGAFLRLLIRITSAKRVLEIGTFTGYSALAMAEGLPEDGELITLDKDLEATEIAKEFWQKSPHGKKIKLILGDAIESLKKLHGSFDLVFIDASKSDYINYWNLCMPLVKKGGLFAVDNVLWSGRVLNPKEESDIAIDEFNKYISEDKRVEAVILTVRDGMLLAWKK